MRDVRSIFREIEDAPDFMFQDIDSIHFRNEYGDTPIHIVSYWGDCEAISVLLDAGADIDDIGESGFTPLHCAAQMNKPDAILLLLNKGAQIIEDESGESPLELAFSLGNREAVSVLREST